jgi:hypothetical protein
MKKTVIYSIALSLALIVIGTMQSFAHKVEPRVKNKRVVVTRPLKKVIYHQPNVVVRTGYVWVGGHYKWHKRSSSYVWVNGRYVKQKRGKTWVSGRWVQVSRGWYYQPGGWRTTTRF